MNELVSSSGDRPIINFYLAWLNPAHAQESQDEFDYTQKIEGSSPEGYGQNRKGCAGLDMYSTLAQEKATNHHCMLKIILSLMKFLACNKRLKGGLHLKPTKL